MTLQVKFEALEGFARSTAYAGMPHRPDRSDARAGGPGAAWGSGFAFKDVKGNTARAETFGLTLRLKLAELDLLHRLGAGDTESQTLANAVRDVLAAPAPVSVALWGSLLDQVGRVWRWPVVMGLVAVGVGLLALHPAERFRRRFDLRGLVEAMGAQWPYALSLANEYPY